MFLHMMTVTLNLQIITRTFICVASCMFLLCPRVRTEFYRFLCLLYNRVGSFSSRNPSKAVKLVYKVFVYPAYYCRIARLFSVNTI